MMKLRIQAIAELRSPPFRDGIRWPADLFLHGLRNRSERNS